MINKEKVPVKHEADNFSNEQGFPIIENRSRKKKKRRLLPDIPEKLAMRNKTTAHAQIMMRFKLDAGHDITTDLARSWLLVRVIARQEVHDQWGRR